MDSRQTTDDRILKIPSQAEMLAAGEACLLGETAQHRVVVLKSARAASAFAMERFWGEAYNPYGRSCFYSYADEGPVLVITDRQTHESVYGFCGSNIHSTTPEQLLYLRQVLDHDPALFSPLEAYIHSRVMGQSRCDSFFYRNCDHTSTRYAVNLGDIPPALRTPELCLAAVQHWAPSLQFVPEAWRSAELYRIALQKNAFAVIDHVPDDLGLLTAEFFFNALARDDGLMLDIGRFFPMETLTAAEKAGIYLTAIHKNAKSFRYVKEDCRDAALCLAAVRQEGWMLDHVPTALRTPELCLAAVQQAGRVGRVLMHVPEALRTAELCLAAVMQCGAALEYVPTALRTPELCLLAVQQEGGALAYVPTVLVTPELCLLAVQQQGGALAYVPEAWHTDSLYLAAVQQEDAALEAIPEASRNAALCWMGVQQDYQALKSVPPAMQTAALCLAAVQQHFLALQYVTPALLTPELCLAAVQQNGWALNLIPDPLVTEALCAEALRTWKRHTPSPQRDTPPPLPYAWADKLMREAGVTFDALGYIRVG